jgi:tRNA(Arg) A34 adenosine deaminase TadA
VASVTNAANSLDDILEPERQSLELAWQALLAGTTPVGAVVVDAAGTVIGTGRNAVYAPADPPSISASSLAHAEVNALLGLPVGGVHSDCRLVTSLEPCLMCAGAARMATVGALTVLGADPFSGSSWVLASPLYSRRRPVRVTGPRTDRIGRLASGLHVAYYLRRRPDGSVISAYRGLRPDLHAAGEALVGAGLFDLTERQVPWSEAGPTLLAAL